MPTTPQPPESVESVINGIIQEVGDWTTGSRGESIPLLVKRSTTVYQLECLMRKALLASYESGIADGRASMKRDIEAVIPGERRTCSEEPCEHTLRMDRALFDLDRSYNDCRSELLANIKDIV